MQAVACRTFGPLSETAGVSLIRRLIPHSPKKLSALRMHNCDGVPSAHHVRLILLTENQDDLLWRKCFDGVRKELCVPSK